MARILLIDDDVNLLQMVKLMLERVGHQVTTSNNGEEGILLAAKSQPDLGIIDVMMPGLSGYDVVRQLRSDPLTARIPIIILTARSQPMDKHMALEAGANAFLSKPVTAQELTDRVDAVMKAGVNYRVHTGLLTEPIGLDEMEDQADQLGAADPRAARDPTASQPVPPEGFPRTHTHPVRTTPVPAPLSDHMPDRPPTSPSPPVPGRTPSDRKPPIGADDIDKIPAAPPPTTPTPPQGLASLRPGGRVPIGADDIAKSSEVAPPPGRPLIVTVISLRGGTGTTTVAVNLAALLASRKRRVCLADMSTSSGQVPLHLRLQPTKNWSQLLTEGDTPDAQSIMQLLVRHPQTGIALLSAPTMPTAQTLSTPATQHTLRELAGTFSHIIVDAPHLDTATVGALRSSAAVVVVMTDDPPAIQATIQLLALLPNLGLETGRVRVVLNHIRPIPDIAPDSIQRMIKRPLTVNLPYDSNQISAMRRGLPLVLVNPDGPFAEQVEQLARTIAM